MMKLNKKFRNVKNRITLHSKLKPLRLTLIQKYKLHDYSIKRSKTINLVEPVFIRHQDRALILLILMKKTLKKLKLTKTNCLNQRFKLQ
jgi:hypothetical protein